MLQFSSEMLEWGDHVGNYPLCLVSGISMKELGGEGKRNCYPGVHYLLSPLGLQTKVEGTLAVIAYPALCSA